MKMLKTLNGIGIFKNDDVWFPTYYTYNTMWNFSDASSNLAKVRMGTSYISIMLEFKKILALISIGTRKKII
jgi:hypothetical protein